jgi:DNA-directed RNA polymerase specialized sigma24 family protein
VQPFENGKKRDRDFAGDLTLLFGRRNVILDDRLRQPGARVFVAFLLRVPQTIQVSAAPCLDAASANLCIRQSGLQACDGCRVLVPGPLLAGHSRENLVGSVTFGARIRLTDMGDATRTFERLRPRLKGIACRILDSESEVELVLRDAYLRWHEVGLAEQGRAEAWLISTVARLCLDRFGGLTEGASDSTESESGLTERSIGEPEPVTPEQMQERADDLSVSFLTLIAQLAPETRTAFVLREMFRVKYDVLAQIVGKSDAECAQMVRHARAWLRARRPR